MANQTDDGLPERDDRGFLRAVLPNRPRTAGDVNAFVAEARRLSADKPVPVLLDARHVPTARPSAFSVAVKAVESFASAVAIVVSPNTPAEIEIFQRQIDARLVPCRMFDELEAAEGWVSSFEQAG